MLQRPGVAAFDNLIIFVSSPVAGIMCSQIEFGLSAICLYPNTLAEDFIPFPKMFVRITELESVVDVFRHLWQLLEHQVLNFVLLL